MYFLRKGFDENDLLELNTRIGVIFISTVSKTCGSLESQHFFRIIDKFITIKLSDFNVSYTERMLDIFKYFQHYPYYKTKRLLQNHLEDLQNYKLNKAIKPIEHKANDAL